MAHFGQYDDYRRDELIRIIEHSVEKFFASRSATKETLVQARKRQSRADISRVLALQASRARARGSIL